MGRGGREGGKGEGGGSEGEERKGFMTTSIAHKRSQFTDSG